MAETIYHGYVIHRQEYLIFDEIVTFLTKQGNKIACLSKGSRKIDSKNARHLFLGSFVEFQIFQSRSIDKLSRLKKVITIKSVDWSLVTALSFNLLNESVIKLDMRDQSLFEFYEKYLQQILEKQIYEKILVLIVLQNFLKFSGVRLEVNHCIRCGNNKIKTISFKDHGMLCNLCFEKARDKYYELPVSKAIHYLFNEKYTMLNQYVQEIDYVIKLLYAYILDNTGVKFQSLADYETS